MEHNSSYNQCPEECFKTTLPPPMRLSSNYIVHYKLYISAEYKLLMYGVLLFDFVRQGIHQNHK